MPESFKIATASLYGSGPVRGRRDLLSRVTPVSPVWEESLHSCVSGMTSHQRFPSSEHRLSTTLKAMREVFEGMPRCRFALETGMHSPVVSRLLNESAHEAIVAHARNVRLIGERLLHHLVHDRRCACSRVGISIVVSRDRVGTNGKTGLGKFSHTAADSPESDAGCPIQKLHLTCRSRARA